MTVIGKDFPVRAYAFLLSSEKRASSAAISPADTLCFDIFSPRAAMVELAWTWLRWQPDSALSVWFRARVGAMGGRIKKIMIVALARKLLVALWRYVKDGVIPDGAKMKAA